MQRIFSGIQPTGEIHIGNYFGAINNWIKLQNESDKECIYSIVDYHALCGEVFGQKLRDNVIQIATLLLACGIDPEKVTLFVQSQVPEHTELAWIFNTIIPVAELERMTQFKDKSLTQNKNINAGLLTYPVLQAADILLYKAEAVPVGEDQLQHIELTRIIARKFNNKFEQFFAEPKDLLNKASKLMALNDPSKKMSKSSGPKAYIAMLDTPETIRQKISKAVTDTGEDGQIGPGVANLLNILSQIKPELATNCENKIKQKTLSYSEFKTTVADTLVEFLSPIQAKYAELSKEPARVGQILEAGGKKARAIAQQNLAEIKKIVGLS